MRYLKRMKAREDKDAYLLVFDALVFLVILSAAAIIPQILMDEQESTSRISEYTSLQMRTQAGLEVVLQATIPQVELPGNITMQHAQVGIVLQKMVVDVDNGTPEEEYNVLGAEVNRLLQKTIPISDSACLLVVYNNTEIIVGTHPPMDSDIAVASQSYAGTGVSIVLKQWTI